MFYAFFETLKLTYDKEDILRNKLIIDFFEFDKTARTVEVFCIHGISNNQLQETFDEIKHKDFSVISPRVSVIS